MIFIFFMDSLKQLGLEHYIVGMRIAKLSSIVLINVEIMFLIAPLK